MDEMNKKIKELVEEKKKEKCLSKYEWNNKIIEEWGQKGRERKENKTRKKVLTMNVDKIPKIKNKYLK